MKQMSRTLFLALVLGVNVVIWLLILWVGRLVLQPG